MSAGRRHWIWSAGAALALGFALFELALRGAVDRGWLRLPAPPPRAAAEFWDGRDPRFGVWHEPNAELVHATACFSATYRTNSVGARDRERPRESAEARVVVLGDSFIEGWGLGDGERLSDRLERDTGLPHLNFGMSHHGPYQSALVYRELARHFAHSAVIVGITPMNDFVDLDYELARRTPGYAYAYRPYLIGAYPSYREFFYREPRVAGWVRRHSFAANALVFAQRRLAAALGPRERLRRPPPEGFTSSWEYDFRDADFDRLRYSIERIADAAGGRRIALLLIPTLLDFARAAQSGPSPLAARLADFAAERRMAFVDLLPALAARREDPRAYFFEPCDYHWNAHANRLAADIASAALGGGFYAAPARAEGAAPATE